MKISSKPVLVTHAGCAAIHPHPRHKSDALLRALEPTRFVELARNIVADDKDYEDIRATTLSALTHMADRANLSGDSGFVDRVREIASSTPLANLRAVAGRFMKTQ